MASSDRLEKNESMIITSCCVFIVPSLNPLFITKKIKFLEFLSSLDRREDTYIYIFLAIPTSTHKTILLLDPPENTQNYLVDHLVGGFNPSEKYEFVNWDDYSQ